MKNFALIGASGYIVPRHIYTYDIVTGRLEIRGGFTDLHTVSYNEILKGNGYVLEAPRQAIEIVHAIRHAVPIGAKGEYPHL